MNKATVDGPAGRRIPGKATRVALLLLPVVLAACGEAAQAPAATIATPPRLDYPGKSSIPVRLDMRGTADGGRAVAIQGAWRGTVAFDGADDDAHCGIQRGGVAALEPGSSHDVHLICSRAVRLPDEGSRGFRVLEDGREIATGSVLP
ncbi:hypothetical protein WCE39_10220 [Luteimonas sp. MJ174]|uniref:hypothetical protein n=1 Tax=Luteimonas sp. MJ174 TaxID=3129237 RepID=UPI0031BBC063